MRKNWDIGPTLILMIETQLVSLSTSLFLLESQYGRMNSNGEAWSHYVHKNRSSGPTLIVRISTNLVPLSTSLFLLESQYGRINSNREAWSHYVYIRKNRNSGPIFTLMIETKVVSLSRSLFLLDGQGTWKLLKKDWAKILAFFCSVLDSHPSPSLLQKWSHFLRHCSYSSPSMVVWIAMEKLGPTTYTRIEAVVPLWSSGFQHELVSLSTSRFMLKRRRMWQVLKKDWAKKK